MKKEVSGTDKPEKEFKSLVNNCKILNKKTYQENNKRRANATDSGSHGAHTHSNIPIK